MLQSTQNLGAKVHGLLPGQGNRRAAWRYSFKVMPSTYSMTMYCNLSVTEYQTLTMLGWLRNGDCLRLVLEAADQFLIVQFVF